MGTVDQVEVLPAIPIGVKKRRARAKGLDIVVFALSTVVVLEVNSGFLGNFPVAHLCLYSGDTSAQDGQYCVSSHILTARLL